MRAYSFRVRNRENPETRRTIIITAGYRAAAVSPVTSSEDAYYSPCRITRSVLDETF